MRSGLTLTRREKKQIENTIKKLDQSYQRGKVNPMVYRSQRGKLLADLKRPMAERTAINLNQEGFFRKRNNVRTGPAPVGYWQSNRSPAANDGGDYWDRNIRNIRNAPRRRVSDNKVRSALINISENGYWNSQDFQEALQIASSANQQAQQNNASYFQQAVMKSQALGSAQSTLSQAGLWEQIQNSEPVVKALQRLESTIDYTVQRMYAVGISKQEAKSAIKQVAISSGQAMTLSGYSKEQAAKIVAMVIRGELGVNAAIAQVSGELNQAAVNISALNNGTNQLTPPPSNARRFDAAWHNNFDIHGNGTPTGVSMAALMETKNQLEQKFDLSNNPVERNQLSQSISQIEQTLNQRQKGINTVPPMTKKPNSSTQGPVTASYDPRDNLSANRSLMQQTSAALNRGGPSIVTVVKDLFTVDGHLYMDWTAGQPISVANNGGYTNATRNSDSASVFASGEWTVFASNKNAIPTLKSILNSIGYALASPLWSEHDRAYLNYLKRETSRRIEYLDIGLTNLPVVSQNNSANNSAIVQNAIQQNANSPEDTLFGGEVYMQHLNSLPTDDLRKIVLDTAYRYMKQGIGYIGADGMPAMDAGDIMLQIAGSELQFQKDAGLMLVAGGKLYPGETNAEIVILMELFHEGYNMSFLSSRPDLIELYLSASQTPPQAKEILIPLLNSLGFRTGLQNSNNANYMPLPAPPPQMPVPHDHYRTKDNGIEMLGKHPYNQNQHMNIHGKGWANNMPTNQRKLAQQARLAQQAQAKAAQQAERKAQQVLQQQAKAAQQAERKAQQARQAQAKAAQQAERKALQQAQRRANQEGRKAEQQAKRMAAQNARAAQQAAQKAAQQAAQQAQSAKQNLPPSMIAPIAKRSSAFRRTRPSFSRGLRGSTSTTMSTRSHGGARFTNDPRTNNRY